MPISRDIIYRVLEKCTEKNDLSAGRRVHSIMVKSGFDTMSVLGDHLIRLFGSCGSLLEANLVFCKVSEPSVFTWQAIISAHSMHGESCAALHLYSKMLDEDICPDHVTFLCTLKACGIVGSLDQGKHIHDHIIQSGHEKDVKVGNTLVDMYGKCGGLEEAAKVFRNLQNQNVVSWTAMIAGYAQHGHGIIALEYYGKMKQLGIKPDSFTFSYLLKSCSSLGDVLKGKMVHNQIVGCGLESNLTVGNSLVDMYAKCGSLEEAHTVFQKLPARNVVSWNAMITGYAQRGDFPHGLGLFERMQQDSIKPNVVSWNALISGYVQHELGFHAFELFQKMQEVGVKPDKVTFLCILKACSMIGALKQGRLVHSQTVTCQLDLDVDVGNTLVDMYAKCSSLDEACRMLAEVKDRNVVSWGAMMGGYVQHGFYKLAMRCLGDMREEGLHPVGDTFTSILTACNKLGHVEEGHQNFKSMREEHGIQPSVKHFNCMVNIVGRAGWLGEAAEMLHTMPFLPNMTGWTSLLTSCKTFGNAELGRKCFDQVALLNPNIASGYMLMSNIYADCLRWDDVYKIQQMKREAGAWKKPGRSWIEVSGKVEEFVARDRSHQCNDTILAEIKRLRRQAEEEGHVPQFNLVSEPLSDEEKADVLWGHSEKLAVAFGLLSTPTGTTIRVTKNLRLCEDCHNVMKIISKIERRQIIIRDGLRVHHFENGLCSCEDEYL